MKVNEINQVFNLYDTNGRRSDTINAYKIYCNILERVYEESESGRWGRYPKESTQFNFYKLAIEESPEVFKDHPQYDKFVEAMNEPQIKSMFLNSYKGDIECLKKKKETKELLENLDKHIESRARHYTSNLVKIGLADDDRRLSPIAKSWIYGNKLYRSRFENLLPIDDTNLMFLRQLLKLRVYRKDCTRYYSPMMMAFKILLTYDRIDKKDFISMIQMLNPYSNINASNFIQEYMNGNKGNLHENLIEFDLGEITKEPIPMSNEIFSKYFKNTKSKNAIKVYREFYEILIEFNSSRNEKELEKIVNLFSNSRNKNMLNKAFGFGNNIFNFDKKDKMDVNKFMQLNKDSNLLTNEKLNEKLAHKFTASKRYDTIQEYGDVTRRVMKVTGIISFKNDIVELVNRDLWEKVFKEIDIDSHIFNDSTAEDYDSYEKDITSPFFNHITLDKILNLEDENMASIIDEIKADYRKDEASDEDVRSILYNKTSDAFIEHIEKNYPKEKVLEILPLFSDRSNDSKIQEMVAKNTDVPTIFEFIIGIAWYHISSKKFDLFSSLNLSMSADFEPETHAGGGAGDIVIEYDDSILMIEVTMMNKQAQKRGEWEPVLRHATNLTVESAPKDVTTLFIADELDENTINIWRAVASVPLKSSRSSKFAQNIKIMPLNNSEIFNILTKGEGDTELLKRIKESFESLSTDFDMQWREKIVNNQIIS